MSAETTKAVAEIVIDESGEVISVERYILSRSHRKGDTFIRDYKEYFVLDSSITFGKHGGALVEHVVRLIAYKGTPIQ